MARVVKKVQPKRSKTVTSANNLNHKINMVYMDVDDIKPYDRNPRNNEEAVKVLRNAIRTQAFMIPIVVDKNNVIVAGHTRYQAAIAEGLTQIPTIKADHLNDTQIKAFRISDNKIAEIATWNADYLAMEMQEIIASGIDMTQLGYTEHEIDCLHDMISDDCLSAGDMVEDTLSSKDKTHTPRAPVNTRMVIGEFVLFVPTSKYKMWAAALRTEHEFNAEAINTALKERLGIAEFLT